MPDPALRARHCPPDRYDSLLLHVSNFRPVKRLDAVVDVFRRVRERRRAKIVLVGDGPERGRVETLAREAGIAEHVEILGEVDDVRGLLSVADVFLLPSAQESFGLAALEAMACGVPVVASRVGGLPEVITDGLTGYLRDPDDQEGMAAAVLDLLDDPSLRQRVAHLARASVVDRFDEDRVVPMYEALYERLLTVPAAGSRA